MNNLDKEIEEILNHIVDADITRVEFETQLKALILKTCEEESKEEILKKIFDYSREDIEELHTKIGDFIQEIISDESR